MRNLVVAAVLVAVPHADASQTADSGLRDLQADAPAVLAAQAGAGCTATAGGRPLLDTVAEVDAALVAVAAVLDPQLMAARNACLSDLGEARRTMLIEAAGTH